jgi:hypothetical protein
LVQLDVGRTQCLVVFQIVAKHIDPTELVQRYFERVLSGQLAGPRYIARMIPLQFIFRACTDELNEAVPPFIKEKFEHVPDDLSVRSN